MYAKCGVLSKANEVLEKLPSRNVITWNALISGYAQMGRFNEAFSCFKRMQHEDVAPDEVTFLCILTTCGHSGLFYEAEVIFGDMIRKYNITPSLEHHTCMLMVFGTSGDFDKAVSMIKVMPCSDHAEIWLTLLGACKKWGYVELGRLAFDQAVQVCANCSSAYVLMANIFASAGMQEDANKVEALRAEICHLEETGLDTKV
jgi:pentatricopeptide repeat protein